MVACLQAQLAHAPDPDWAEHDLTAVDPDTLLAICQEHEVTPLVYRTLQSLKLDKAFLEPFSLEVNAQTLWTFELTQHLLTILRRFGEAGIPVLPHKGVILSQRLFTDIARRPTKDLDIVVPKRFYLEAKACLQSLGYSGPSADSGDQLDEAWEKRYLRRMHHVNFIHPDSGVATELHWQLSPAFRGFRLERELWSALEPYTFFGVETLKPHKALLFALLCEHGAAHHYFRLKWLFDAAVLIDQAQSAGDFHPRSPPSLHNQLVATSLMCQTLFGLEPPGGPVTRTQHWLAERMLEQFRTFPITHITGADRYRVQLALLNSRDPRLVWPVFRHYLYEDDSFRWHKEGWASYQASLLRLWQRSLNIYPGEDENTRRG